MCAVIASFFGALMIVLGLALNAAITPAGIGISVIGLMLSASGAFFLGSAWSGIKPHDAEDIQDARWQLSDNAARYRQFLNSQSDFIIRRTRDGRVVFANASFLDAFAVRSEDILDTHYHPHALRTETPANSSPTCYRTLELLMTRGGNRWITWNETEVPAPDGNIEIQSVGRDVTAERETEEALRNDRDRAELANREKSRFLASMSHEIRTPMNGLIGMLSLLRDTKLDPEQRTYARVAEDSSRVLLGLIDGILDFSKIEAGKLELADECFSLKHCVAQMMQLMTPDATAKNLTLQFHISDALPEWVRGDEIRLRQIILNLLSNAIKFTNAGGVSVHVGTAADRAAKPDHLRLSIAVSDTGIGFSPEAGRRLFGEFEQDSSAMSHNPGGTGLGLAISKRIAQAMSGEIVAAPGENEGAVFTARLELRLAPSLPIAAAPPSRATVQEATEEIPYDGRAAAHVPFRVLVAEDNQINALLACKIIDRAGGHATVVEDGRAAIAIIWETLECRRPTFDLILMDVLMPEIDGIIATKSIKALYRNHNAHGFSCPPIIALTANAFAEDRERCRAAGMDDYLAKPFDARDLHGLLLHWTAEAARVAPPAA